MDARRLLLGGIAALVAVVGAHAADALISSAAGNTPAMTRRRSAFPAPPTAGGAATAGATPNGANNVYFARAFVQFAGFTAGKAVSVFDFFDTARYSLQTNFAYQDLGRFGINTFNYTAQLGNGWSAGLGIEDGTFYARPIKDLNAAPPAG